jgi:hypothetical protein
MSGSSAATRAEPASAIPALHLAIRFALELACLASLGWWGWHAAAGRFAGGVIAAACVLVAGGIWSTFATPGDPRRGLPRIAVAGWARWLLEAAFFALASAALWSVWSRAAAETLMTVILLHAAVTWERQWWLLRAPRRRRDE